MKRRLNGGFTLIELLVVITIIGMLMAMLMPAVQAAREAARRATCSSNLGQLALAAQSYEASWQKFPGSQVLIGKKVAAGADDEEEAYNASWLVPLFPHLGENPLYKQWSDFEREDERKPRVLLDFMICASDPPLTTNRGDTWANYRANGRIFREKNKGAGRSMDYLNANDGASKTLLFSERTPNHRWDSLVHRKITFSCAPSFGLDGLKDWLGSNHAGVVNAAFCDRHVRAINEEIENEVYHLLVNPDDIKYKNRKILDDAMIQ